MTTNYAVSDYRISSGIQPTAPVLRVTECLPAKSTSVSSISALDSGTLAPLGLVYDVSKSAAVGETSSVLRTVALRTVANPYVNGNELWQTDVSSDGLVYATQNLFVGELAMSTSCAVLVEGVSIT